MSSVAENLEPEEDTTLGNDIISMDDEEFSKLDPSSFDDPDQPLEEEEEDQPEDQEEPEEDSSEDLEEEPDEGTPSEEEDTTEPPEDSAQDHQDMFDGKSSQEDEDHSLDQESDDTDDQKLDYKAEYERLFAPLKAAKREIRVGNVDDARRLMQMGVDYSKKMENMKHDLRIVKTLENNDLLDPEKINFLIDLHNKNPQAIQKYLKDAEIDPLDISLEEDSTEYTPTDHAANPQEMVLNEVLESIRDTPTFERTVDELTNNWDQASKQHLFDNPHLIPMINDHMDKGIYDQIMNVVEQERMFGRMKGMSNLEAYNTVGNAIHAKGGFKPYSGNGTSKRGSSQVSGSRSSRKEEQLRKRKQAASPTRGKGAKTKEVTNFLESLSDEEIEKMGPPIL